jgi:tetratricopeptide (TPR) repeat protein
MKMLRVLHIFATASIALFLIPASIALADGGGNDGGGRYDNSPLDPIFKMIEAEQYERAIVALHQELEKDQNNADALNLLGFSNRKLKDYDEALKYYQLALSIEPRHRGANEYLGQLYLETNQLEKAKERLAVLDKACFFPCSEYTSLKKAVQAYAQ